MPDPLQAALVRLDTALRKVDGGLFNPVNLREAVAACRACFAATAEEIAALRLHVERRPFVTGADD